MPKNGEDLEEEKPIGQEIRQTFFRVQFLWQPVPREQREVNDIIMQLVAGRETTATPNLEVPFDQIQKEVDKRNEDIASENERIKQENAELPKDDSNRRLTRELLQVTQEQYDAFKQRFLVKGTKETGPSSAAGTSQASSES